MGDLEEEEIVDYKLIPADGSGELTSSHGFTGRAEQVVYPLRGELYEGDFVNGLRQGKGKYSYGNGDKYEGDFFENKKHGIGKMVYNENGQYHGYFENGTRHGEGVFIYPNGDVYSGWWKNGKKHGKGTYVFKESKMKFIGEWGDGNILNGTWQYHNGVHYRGGFENNKPKGEGVWVFANGNVCNGEYKQTIVPLEGEGDEEGAETEVKLDWTSKQNMGEGMSAIV